MIQIVEGPSGSGKSHLVYKEIIQLSIEFPEKRFFLIVPEQFTMQAQRDIVTLHPKHGTMNIDIVSFNRLAYRVFEELNIRCDQVLEDFGKSMLLQRILIENRKELPVFGACLNKAGFIDELKSLFTELFQYRIGRETMKEVYERLPGQEMLKRKLHDLLFVYDTFQQEIQGRYIIAEHVLEMLAKHVPASKLLQGSILYLDGYTGFTPVQYELLEELAQVSEALHITVTIDKASAEQETCAEHALFYLSKDTICRIRQLGDRLGIYVEETFLEGRCPRFTGAEGLRHLEENLFRYPYAVWKEPVQDIHIQVMGNPREELRKVARQIHAMVRNGQYRYQDIAVIHGKLEELEPLAEELLPRFGIPYFMDTNRSIYMNPCLECIRAVLDIVEKDYSYESVFRFLKTGVTGIEPDLLEQLENYVIRRGIQGYSWWQTVFQTDAEEAAMLPVLRCGAAVLARLAPVTQALRQAETVSDYIRILQDLLETLNMREQLETAADTFEADGNLIQAKAYRQIYGKISEIWEKMDAILGKEGMKPEEFRSVLEIGLDDIALGVIPPSLDQVTIGDIERTRLNHVKVLFVLGINDGIIPRVTKGGGILSEADRSLLSQDLELAPDARSRVFREQFYLYQNVTKPSKALYLTYHVQDGDGNEVLPAYLIGRIQKLFPALKQELLVKEEFHWSCLETWEDSTDMISAVFQQEEHMTELEADLWKGLYAYYQANEPQILLRIRQGMRYNNVEHYIHPKTAARLYGTILNTSVSRLETYSRCPYQFYLEYGLGLKKREKNEVTLGDMGSLLHHVVEQIFKRVENREAEAILLSETGETIWDTITDDELVRMVEEEIQEAVGQEENSVYLYSHANRQLLNRIQQTAAYAAVDLRQQLLRGTMIPYRFEMTFNRNASDSDCQHLEAAELSLGQEALMRMSGIIDRIDICQDEEHVYVKVLDYKSSSKDIDADYVNAGLQLQLLVYTNVVLEVLQKKFPEKEIIPAGSLYYGFHIPMVEKTSKKITEALSRKISKETALTGIINKEEPCISLLGDEGILPIRLKEMDGVSTVMDSEHVLSLEQYQTLLAQARDTAALIGSAMLEGQIPIRPVRTGRSLPCDYCDYQDICKLDCGDGGNQICTVKQLRELRKGENSHGMDSSSKSSH
ncbi:MAG: exodeoxyribonuclease V subunit gamma [Bacteroides sp.]|nr:exodeoxyribonuclease V subunit gamma [Bacteroides sp.]MCM1549673.1 exodeoxyribonuclease V subunit gamma [Clostridium sp.]